MGTYLSSPVTTKHSEDGCNGRLSFGASSMQGWRLKQEDAHNCILEFDKNISLFAVYDGHGGSEVAAYTSQEFPTYLRNNEKYKKGLYEDALVESFLGFDDTIATPEVMEQLKKLIIAENETSAEIEGDSLLECSRGGCSSSCSSNGDVCDDDEDFDSLRREANKPLEEVMASYGVPKDDKLASSCLKEKCCDAGQSSARSSGFSGECSSSSVILSSDDASSSGCSSTGTKEVNGCSSKQNQTSGESVVNGDAESSFLKCDSSTSAISKESENETDIRKCSKKEPLSNGPSNDSLVNGNANSINGDIKKDTESVEKRSKRIPKETETNSSSSSQPGTSPKKKKLALTDLDDSDVVKNFITNDEIDEDDEDDSEDETFQVSNEDLNSEDDDDDDDDEPGFILNKKTLTAELLRRLQQNNLEFDNDDDDDDDCDDDDDDDDDNNDDEDDVQNPDTLKSSELNVGDDNDDDENDEFEEQEDETEDEEDDDNSESIEEEEDQEEEDDDGIEGPGIDSGCTAVVALIKGDSLYVANAGDSRCIICKGGVAVDMSIDHTPLIRTERIRILNAGGHIHEGRVNNGLNLSRAIGDHSYKNNKSLPNTEQMITALPDVKISKLESDVEFVVLACDGIWNSMTSQEVVDFIRPKIKSHKKLSSICEEMFDKCLSKSTACDESGCDNMTCIIIKTSPNSDLTNDEQQATEINVPPVPKDNTSKPVDNTTSTATDDTKESVDENTNTSTNCDAKVNDQNASENCTNGDFSISKGLKRKLDTNDTDISNKREKTDAVAEEDCSCGDLVK